MFPEYRELITRIKGQDVHFTRLFEKHNELDHRIRNMEERIIAATVHEIEKLKKEKLLLKDQIYAHLRRLDGAQA
ncbi:MAG: DUF465 domain-containing protein [Proteobacteria bacterium]|nr:DUF465 domain-containing protein [Pseudomonadota bacterium]